MMILIDRTTYETTHHPATNEPNSHHLSSIVLSVCRNNNILTSRKQSNSGRMIYRATMGNVDDDDDDTKHDLSRQAKKNKRDVNEIMRNETVEHVDCKKYIHAYFFDMERNENSFLALDYIDLWNFSSSSISRSFFS